MPWWNMQTYGNFQFERFLSLPFLVPSLIWSFFWKGLTLYKAARNEQKGWFVVLLVVNTLGILEIIYLLLFSNPRLSSKNKKKK